MHGGGGAEILIPCPPSLQIHFSRAHQFLKGWFPFRKAETTIEIKRSEF